MSTIKKRKKNYRFYILLIVLCILCFFLITKGLTYLTTSQTERDLQKLKYSNDAISLIIDKKIDKYIINNKIYSKTLETALVEGQYDNSLLETYIDLPYKEYDDYISQINKLSTIGYTKDDIEKVFKSLNSNDINLIIKKDKVIENLTSYIDKDYFKIDNLDRYVNYKSENSKYDYDQVISNVNMYLDYPYYEHDVTVTDPNNLLVIVNKYYKLSSSFVPKGLTSISTKYAVDNQRFVIPIVKENFEKMAADMEKLGLAIKAKSAYRSYQTQVDLYNDYVKASGKDAADTFSARAGYSEHQTGMAIDVVSSSKNYSIFETTPEYRWMKQNAYKYGFILRYPSDKTNITGYKFESWHFRYVGNDVAKYIYDHNITFDEYYAMFVANKKTNK